MVADINLKPVHTPAAIVLQADAPAHLNIEEKGYVARLIDRNAREHTHGIPGNDEKSTRLWTSILSKDPEALHGLIELEKRKDEKERQR